MQILPERLFVKQQAILYNSHTSDTFRYFSEFGFNFGVIMVKETWCCSDNEVLHSENYSSFYLNRNAHHGGGVLLQEYKGFYSGEEGVAALLRYSFHVLS